MYCEKCGFEIEDSQIGVRCPKCGRKLERNEDVDASQKGKGGSAGVIAIVSVISIVLIVSVIVILIVVGNKNNNQMKQLCGEWEDANGVLSLDFEKDGSLRVGAGGGIIGAELLTYDLVDENTIELRPDITGVEVPDFVSFRIDYEIVQDELTLEILGNEYVLERID